MILFLSNSNKDESKFDPLEKILKKLLTSDVIILLRYLSLKKLLPMNLISIIFEIFPSEILKIKFTLSSE